MQMKTVLRITVVTMILGFLIIADIPRLPVQLVPDAEAIFGVRRRAFRRGVFLGAAAEDTAAHSAQSQSSAVAQQQSATAQQQSATAQQESATAQQQSAAAKHAAAGVPPAPSGAGDKPLPIGTVVSALPGGCTSTPVGDVEYYYCGGNFYRAVFQGNQLVYVTEKP
jgi:hypothetical protein